MAYDRAAMWFASIIDGWAGEYREAGMRKGAVRQALKDFMEMEYADNRDAGKNITGAAYKKKLRDGRKLIRERENRVSGLNRKRRHK